MAQPTLLNVRLGRRQSVSPVSVSVKDKAAAKGEFLTGFYLPGDADGDLKVTKKDVAAIKALKGVKVGAADFFTKPWQNAQLVELIRTTLELAQPRANPAADRDALDREYDFRGIVGAHPDLLKVLATVVGERRELSLSVKVKLKKV